MDKLKKWALPFFLWIIFEIVAVSLWLTKDNLFYLLQRVYPVHGVREGMPEESSVRVKVDGM